MALLMGATTWLLTSVRTQWLERRINANEVENIRDRLRLESAFELALDAIAQGYRTWAWQPLNTAGEEVTSVPLDQMPLADAARPIPSATITRQKRFPHLFRLRAFIEPDGRAQVGMVVEQLVRPIGVLSPSGELAPPLVIDGCIANVSGRPDIYPSAGDTGSPAVIWSSQPADCNTLRGLDLHGGGLLGNQFRPGTLWTFLFTVTPGEFRELADRERSARSDRSKRRYWWVQQSDLTSGRWSWSLGTPDSPVALVFPADVGCPPIVDGVKVVGIVVYLGDCSRNARLTGRIYGTLALSGSLADYRESLKLAHISRLTSSTAELAFPVLSVVRLPGTWKDFP